MTNASESQADKIRRYYDETTEQSYIANWSKESLGFHLGLADETTQSNEEAIMNTNRFLAERAEVKAGSRVLDAGCGVGGSGFFLAKTFGAMVVGVSIVERQVAIARKFAAERGLEGLIRFECRDMAETGLPEASFDIVWNIESICHLTEVAPYFGEVMRLLDDQGRFVFIDFCRTLEGTPELTEQVAAGWALAPLRTPQELEASLHEAGFAEVEYVDMTGRAMKSAQAMRAMASKRLMMLKAEKAFGGPENPIYEAHSRAAIAMADGMEKGETIVAHFLAKRPRR